MMRWHGVRIDYEKAEQENDRLNRENGELLQAIYGYVPGINPFSPAQLGESLRDRGITPPKTEKGNDSVSNDFLLSLDDPFCQLLGKYRQQEKIRRDFIEGVILNQSYKHRIHAQFYQTRGTSFMSDNDTGGTRSGRLASSNPNLQQIPARHPTLGKLVRSFFLPDEGEMWISGDYQAQEIRVGIHYAYSLGLDGAAEFRQRYIDSPDFDYHTYTMELINKVAPKKVSRFVAKTANLSIQYGIGKKKLSDNLGMSLKDTADFLDAYHEALPFVREALRVAADYADKRGFVKTFTGRRRHFDTWEPQRFMRGMFPVSGYEKALAKYGPGIRKAGLHKAFNSVVQGTSAEMMKIALVKADEAGLRLINTVHDELNVSGSISQEKRLKELMETVIELSVPIVADVKSGANWSETK